MFISFAVSNKMLMDLEKYWFIEMFIGYNPLYSYPRNRTLNPEFQVRNLSFLRQRIVRAKYNPTSAVVYYPALYNTLVEVQYILYCRSLAV